MPVQLYLLKQLEQTILKLKGLVETTRILYISKLNNLDERTSSREDIDY